MSNTFIITFIATTMRSAFIFFVCLLLSGLYSCDKKQSIYPSEILLADSLMDSRPDSALAILTNIQEDLLDGPENIQRYYQLLTIKAQDKCFITHTSDSLMKEVVLYYEKLGTPIQKAEAYYYLGSVYRDMGFAPKAIDCFQQTTHVLQNLTDYRAYKLIGLTYS